MVASRWDDATDDDNDEFSTPVLPPPPPGTCDDMDDDMDDEANARGDMRRANGGTPKPRETPEPEGN